MEIKNAIIKSVQLVSQDGVLSARLHLDFCCFSQAFSWYSLYLGKSFKHHELKSVAGHFIFRVLEVADVLEWGDLIGKSIRAKTTFHKIEEIGHIVKDDWFNPEKDFECIGE